MINLTIQMLNKVFLAYFINICENEGIDFNNSRPTFSPIKHMSEGYFVPNNDYAYMKHFHIGKVVIMPININIKDISSRRLEDFFDENIKFEIEKCAKEFCKVVKKYPHSDLIFSKLPEEPPFICCFYKDEDTGVSFRSIYGLLLHENYDALVLDFYCLIIQRLRQIDSISDIYPETYMDVEKMTPEQREKFDKQPEKKELTNEIRS